MGFLLHTTPGSTPVSEDGPLPWTPTPSPGSWDPYPLRPHNPDYTLNPGVGKGEYLVDRVGRLHGGEGTSLCRPPENRHSSCWRPWTVHSGRPRVRHRSLCLDHTCGFTVFKKGPKCRSTSILGTSSCDVGRPTLEGVHPWDLLVGPTSVSRGVAGV